MARDGSEVGEPRVDVYNLDVDTWSAATPMPVPVDDSVSGVWRDSLIVLVSGWSDGDNVPGVQLYDPAADAWSAGRQIPGPQAAAGTPGGGSATQMATQMVSRSWSTTS